MNELSDDHLDDFPDFMDSLYNLPDYRPEPVVAYPLWLTGVMAVTFGIVAVGIVLSVVTIGREAIRVVAR